MSPSHREHRSRGTLGTAMLAGACCLGAVAYGAIVGPSMLPPDQRDVQATTAMTPDLAPDADEPEEVVAEGPSGRLQVQVSDRGRAWVQTLMCTGNLEEDPAACAELARVAEEFHADTGEPATVQEESVDAEGGGEDGVGAAEDAEGAEDGAQPSEAVNTGGALLFTEVREGTVCTDKVYGPQEATIVGVWEGHEVETTLTRKGSCEEARWQRLRALTEQIS
ncbi:hypothetical protein HGB46_10665 [Nocardiopsis dassonvillei]|uniref:Secreted protein n=2 Tax=Nocardiopsidaceae TaxID=83676 RepID=D7AXE2_NOCDD|nr:putative secreted protein [Nocardiopsis dassonvillei subsp. dassonvillei DSM 43111]APC34371.1 hypothetical protein A9R04_06570 [Nocardiopsis dassonvillei]NKY79036.1 hypothetical protein [Nocardiopsis dassonvillei]VEI92037.1 Uncharacterised protein [Nocardiopsis dassonvillei]